MGATTNLPKLRKFIQLMKDDGHVFKTVDQYHAALAEEAEVSTHGAEDNSEQLATAAIIGIVLASVFVAVLLTVLALNKRVSFATKAKEVASKAQARGVIQWWPWKQEWLLQMGRLSKVMHAEKAKSNSLTCSSRW